MDSKTWLSILLFVTLSWGQNKQYETFDWRPVRPRQSSPVPYQDDTTTSGYDYRYFNTGPAYGTTGYYQDNSRPYDSDSGAYSADSSYSADYPKSPVPYQKYQYPDDSGSYENYGYTRDDNFNITLERYGGFGGRGDTRGFGAYDYPKKVREVSQDIRDDEPRVGTEFPDLLRLGRTRTVFHHRRNPTHVHPLPPPL